MCIDSPPTICFTYFNLVVASSVFNFFRKVRKQLTWFLPGVGVRFASANTRTQWCGSSKWNQLRTEAIKFHSIILDRILFVLILISPSSLVRRRINVLMMMSSVCVLRFDCSRRCGWICWQGFRDELQQWEKPQSRSFVYTKSKRESVSFIIAPAHSTPVVASVQKKKKARSVSGNG